MVEQTAKYSIEDYKTAKRAQNAVQMFLTLPDGTKTTDYLLVVGTESSEFRSAKYAQEQRAFEISKMESMEQRMDAVEDARINVLASCVKGWSFDVPFTPEAAKDLLKGAPYLTDAVDVFISRRAHFFAKPSTTSSRTRTRKSS